MDYTRMSLDIETRSPVDLKKCGTYVYFDDPDTDLWVACYAFDDEDVRVWVPGDPVPQDIIDYVSGGGVVSAWNAAFERIAWVKVMAPRYGWPTIETNQFECTMVRSLAMGMPGSLDAAGPAFKLPLQKDKEGHALMMRMARPRKINPDGTYVWWDVPERKERLIEYCIRDVETEREASKRTFRISYSERALWVLDQTINDRGVYCDLPALSAAKELAAIAKADFDRQMSGLTDGMVPGCNKNAALVEWAASFDPRVESVAKHAIVTYLAYPDAVPQVCEAFKLRQEAAKSSVSKISAMMNRAQADGRMRGLLQFHGAASTGRWAGRGPQPQNFTRPELRVPEINHALELMVAGEFDAVIWMYGSPLQVISSCLRGMMTPAPGNDFVVADYSAIEARGLAWLAGEEEVLEVFRDHGKIYEFAAAGIYGVPFEKVTKGQRKVGKVATLALGFGGGVGAFQQMAKGYGVSMEPAYESLVSAATGEDIEKAESGHNSYQGRFLSLAAGKIYDTFYKQEGDPSWDLLRTRRDLDDDSDLSKDALELITRVKSDTRTIEEFEKTTISKKEWMASELTKILWRKANPNIVQYWKDLETAAINAVAAANGFPSDKKGKVRSAEHLSRKQYVGPPGRQITYMVSGSFLFCRLPSGRTISYPYPSLEKEEAPWSTPDRKATLTKLTYLGSDRNRPGKMTRLSAYGGLLSENCTQAICRDVMANAITNVESEGYEVVLSVHDELICEVPEDFGDRATEWDEDERCNVDRDPYFESIMCRLPKWADEFPLKAAGWRGKRYRK